MKQRNLTLAEAWRELHLAFIHLGDVVIANARFVLFVIVLGGLLALSYWYIATSLFG